MSISWKKPMALLLVVLMLMPLLISCSTTPPVIAPAQPSEQPTPQPAPEKNPEKEPAPLKLAADGSVRTTAQGRNADVVVETTFKDGKISDVKVVEHMETSVYTDVAIPQILKDIKDNNSYAVDAVSGATATTSAIKRAVLNAIEGKGGDPKAYETKPEVILQPDETTEADVVVIGAGISGIMAATNAGKNGAKVVLLEKTTILGGCSLQSFGTSAYGTRHAAELKEDTAALMIEKFNSWIEHEHYRVDASLLDTYIKNAGRALDYLEEYGYFPGAPTSYLLITYDARKPIYEKMLKENVEDKGGVIYKETTAKSLLTENGAVTGVVATRKDGSTLTVNAKAVIVATGGFGGDSQMVYETSGVKAAVGCLTQTLGEGLKMAWDVGAKVPANLGGLQLHQTLATSNVKGFDLFHTRYPMILCYVPSLLNVSNKGIRYHNEEWNNTATAASNSMAFTGGYTYVLVSQSMIDKLEQGGLVAIGTDISLSIPPEYRPDYTIETVWADTNKVFDAMVEGGWGYFGNSIEELASKAGFDPQVLKENFERYQEYCRNGKDEYFNKSPKYLVEYEYGPYYLVESTYNQLGTVTGLVVNSKFQVLDTKDNPIPGLYSCGADASSSLYDNMYMGRGDAIGWAITSGMCSGESAVAFAK